MAMLGSPALPRCSQELAGVPKSSQMGWPCPALTRGMQKRSPHGTDLPFPPVLLLVPPAHLLRFFHAQSQHHGLNPSSPPFPRAPSLCYFRIRVQLALALSRRSCTECLGHFPAVSIMDNVQSGICGAGGSQIPVILRCWRANSTPTEPPSTIPKPFSPVLPAHQPGAAGVM